jgi:hypothetical protein
MGFGGVMAGHNYITDEVLERDRDELYAAVDGLIQAEKEHPDDTGGEQEMLSFAIIESGNIAMFYGQQRATEKLIELVEYDPDISVQDIIDTMKNLYIGVK